MISTVLCEVLWLVRPTLSACSRLRLSVSEVCIPLHSLVLARTVFVRGGACSLARSHKPCLLCGRIHVLGERDPQRFGRKLDSEDGGEHPGEAHSETHL